MDRSSGAALAALSCICGCAVADAESEPASLPEPPRALIATAGATVLTILTYNIHSGLGPSWAAFRSRGVVEENLGAIVDDLASAAPEPLDVVVLNEVDFAARRSGGVDHAERIAKGLMERTGARYRIVRQETWRRTVPALEVSFGNAVLTRLPVLATESALLAEDAADGARRAGSMALWRGGRRAARSASCRPCVA